MLTFYYHKEPLKALCEYKERMQHKYYTCCDNSRCEQVVTFESPKHQVTELAFSEQL